MVGEHIVGTAVGVYIREYEFRESLLAISSEKLGLRAHGVQISTSCTRDDL